MGVKTETIVTTAITDDLDGKDLPEGTEPIYFGWGGRRREIYLSEAHAQAFEKAVAKYVEASKDVTTLAGGGSPARKRAARGSSSTSADKEELAAIRGWAQSNPDKLAEHDLKVPGDRGRIAAGIVELYNANV